jgi:hypothetical protein
MQNSETMMTSLKAAAGKWEEVERWPAKLSLPHWTVSQAFSKT